MDGLWLYRRLSGFGFMNYRAKIMVVAFLGTHVPLFAIIFYVASGTTTGWGSFLGVLSVALGATLAGTGLTLVVLNHLLRPVLDTSRALRAYRLARTIIPLPSHFTDEVGTLMADASRTLEHLETARLKLEQIDGVTNLANRGRIALDIDARIAAGAPFAVCVVGMHCHDRLAETVDAAHADAALLQMARRLEGFLGTQVRLARIATEQFAFLAGDTADAARDWSVSAETLQDALLQCGAHMKLDRISAQPNLTGGIAVYPRDGKTSDTLLDCAAAAASIVDVGAQISFYSPKARAEALERYRLEEDLRAALKNGQFALHYQPVADLAAGRAVGAEALIRWQHPEQGMISPGRFIPIAESSGLIGAIGLWVMNTACAQLASWNASGLTGLKMAINVSARQFHDPALLAHLQRAIADHGISPAQLEIELTESATMDDFTHSRDVFGKLRDLGIGIAIDDFGTGFASMSQLRRLPFDKLKLDREFVTNVHQRPESQAICAALIALGDGLGLSVLAEGTENEDEIRYLLARGCHLFQGYYLGRPVTAGAFPASIEAPQIRQFTTPAGAADTGTLLRRA